MMLMCLVALPMLILFRNNKKAEVDHSIAVE
jgi:hypothetical protein